jgi:radical SAM-linked protein
MMSAETIFRARLTFAADGPLIYISVLDMGRLWERMLRRAAVPLAYTQGFNPHARMQFAAALPVGYSSACEVVDLYLAEEVAPETLLAAIAPQCPPGLHVLSAEMVDMRGAALQALVREAEYDVELWSEAGPAEVQAALAELLGRPAIERRRIKKGQMAAYDLRPLIRAIEPLSSSPGRHHLHMILACGPQGSGRPEDIVEELGLPTTQHAIQRTALRWADEAALSMPPEGDMAEQEEDE